VSARFSVLAAVTVASLTLVTSPGPSVGAAPTGHNVVSSRDAVSAMTQGNSAAPFRPADKQGYATAYDTRSKVWLTLENGMLSDVYYPTVSTPSVRSLQFVVTDGKTFTDVEGADMRHAVSLADPRSLTYRQVNTAKSGDYRIVKTYVLDPRRSALTVQVRFVSLTGKPYQLYVDYLPALDNAANAGSARSDGSTLVATGPRSASALLTQPALVSATNEYQGPQGGLAQLRQHHHLVRHSPAATDGVVEQTALTPVDGTNGSQLLRLTLGFGGSSEEARSNALATSQTRFDEVQRAYEEGWHSYLASLKARPDDVLKTAQERQLYDVSVMVLAAGEDKTHRGAFVASPTMPWVWREPATNAPLPTGPYHLIWSRDLYQTATALLMAGDTGAAERAEHYLFDQQQEPNGQFPQNSRADGTPYWTGKQLDEWSLPTVLAWQLGDTSAATWQHVQRAEQAVIQTGPWTEQDRWENQSGYNPATIAAEIAGLVCGASLARANGHDAVAQHYLEVADKWQANLKRWTVTDNGPLSSRPYFLRLAKRGEPNRAIHYAIGDSGPASVDQRRVVDPSFLELVRLGVLSPDDPTIRNTLRVVDENLRVATPAGDFWHRYSFDGYGETATGHQWVIEDTNTPKTYGRLWPLLTGERGEYAIAAGEPAEHYLHTMASTAKKGSYLLPEQVWDGRPPTGNGKHRLGKATLSATPLLWTHAQFVRLAWDLHAGRVVEQPAPVARRYGGSAGPTLTTPVSRTQPHHSG
jgi:glucoamylase